MGTDRYHNTTMDPILFLAFVLGIHTAPIVPSPSAADPVPKTEAPVRPHTEHPHPGLHKKAGGSGDKN